MLDTHSWITQIFLAILILGSAFVFVQSGLNLSIGWGTAASVGLMVLIYGFPYMLAIPSVWDIAIRNTVEQLAGLNVAVKNKDTIEDAASLDYLTIQTIGFLDHKLSDEQLDEAKRYVHQLKSMGVKPIIATGV